MFQGGFVGTECEIILLQNDHEKIIKTIFPEDINDLQSFNISDQDHNLIITSNCKLELKFKRSSDFYGRVTVYILNFQGNLIEHDNKE